jgi:DNA-binding MarR family transcriptional regulator
MQAYILSEEDIIKMNKNFLTGCLFFNTNTLSRYLLKLAEKEFKQLHLSPAHASLLLVLYDTPGISSKQLSQQLHLTPSTITRFVDVLEKKGLVLRKTKGKSAFISPSEKGLALKAEVALAYKELVLKYTQILGSKTAHQLSFNISKANQKLDGFICNDN